VPTLLADSGRQRSGTRRECLGKSAAIRERSHAVISARSIGYRLTPMRGGVPNEISDTEMIPTPFGLNVS